MTLEIHTSTLEAKVMVRRSCWRNLPTILSTDWRLESPLICEGMVDNGYQKENTHGRDRPR